MPKRIRDERPNERRMPINAKIVIAAIAGVIGLIIAIAIPFGGIAFSNMPQTPPTKIAKGSPQATSKHFETTPTRTSSERPPTPTSSEVTPPPTILPRVISAINPPQLGPLLYEVDDWSNDLNGWQRSSNSWQAAGTMLVNTGSTVSEWNTKITPLYRPESANYAVEVQILAPNLDTENGSFGIVTRTDPNNSRDIGYDFEIPSPSFSSDPACDSYLFPHTTDTSWHTYLIVVMDNTITCSIDGQILGQIEDNHNSAAGALGLEDYNVQINVRSFKVFAVQE